MSNNLLPRPYQLIKEYFEKLRYGAIKDIKPCLLDDHGNVFLVSFENKIQESGTGAVDAVPPPDCKYPLVEGPPPADWERVPRTVEVAIPNCYAIVIGEKVAGYHEEFWVDADRYRLVLKQHLGLLAMEAKTEQVDEPVAPKSDQEPREGYSKNETVDAIVGRYEEMLVKAEQYYIDTVNEGAAREAALAKQLTDAQAELINAKTKLEVIKQVLEGKPVAADREPTEEEIAIGLHHRAAGEDSILSGNEVFEMPKYSDRGEAINGINRNGLGARAGIYEREAIACAPGM